MAESEKLPRHIKRITEEPQEDGATLITVEFHWWYRPIAWFFMLRSKPFGGFTE